MILNLDWKEDGAVRGNIDVDSIPDFQKNALADMALEITRACFEIPGMEERYQQWLPGYLERKRQREAEGRRWDRQAK